VLNVITKPYL